MASSKAARIGFLIAILGVGAASLILLPLNRWTLALVEWIQGAGATGVLVYALVYVAATLLLVPGSLLTVGAGFAYGPIGGTLLVSPVSVIAALLAFWLGRFVARDWVARRVASNPKFASIDEAVARNSFKIILLLRLSPILPFNLLNYALGLARVRVRDYVLASFIGMLPGTFLYVYLGSLVTSASELASGRAPQAGPWGQILYWGGLVATIAATVWITRLSRKALQDALKQGPKPNAPPEAADPLSRRAASEVRP